MVPGMTGFWLGVLNTEVQALMAETPNSRGLSTCRKCVQDTRERWTWEELVPFKCL